VYPAGLFIPALAVVVAASGVFGQQAKVDALHIGTSGSVTSETSKDKEKSALELLHGFLKDETGFDNEVQRQKSWRELADKMAGGQLQLGVFQGYEFAWARAKHSTLKPLAVAVDVYTFPVVYVVARKDDPAANFAGLQGQSLSLPAVGRSYLNLFVERQSQAQGKDLKSFFAKVVSPDNYEDALDDVVDGVVQAAVVDRSGLEAFKRRKPARFNRLKDVARSEPLPPGVIAFQDGALEQATLQRFRDGLLNAAKKEKGRTLLTYFRLTGFAEVPRDFDQVLARAVKDYPPSSGKK
jgi:ABC-type phosphate/phosphonate transport system substrate-binding protein